MNKNWNNGDNRDKTKIKTTFGRRKHKKLRCFKVIKVYIEFIIEIQKLSIEKMKEYGILISGDAITKGIGAMTDKRWKLFFDSIVNTGVIKPDTNYKEAFTLQFINKGIKAYQ